MYLDLSEDMLDIREVNLMISKVEIEIQLITAQLQILDFCLLDNPNELQSGLKLKLERLYDELSNTRSSLMADQIKERMINSQLAWKHVGD